MRQVFRRETKKRGRHGFNAQAAARFTELTL
jgi:hypothetical protein